MNKFKVGDKVRVKQLLGGVGDTLWEVVAPPHSYTEPFFIVWIREAGTDYTPQRYDTSLLVHDEETR